MSFLLDVQDDYEKQNLRPKAKGYKGKAINCEITNCAKSSKIKFI
jgi:hypothetical protein